MKFVFKKIDNLPASIQEAFGRDLSIFEEYPLFLKGGAARDTLGWFLGKSQTVSLRDLDLVLIGTPTWVIYEVAERLNVDIREIEVISSIQEYMKSRDIGLNEVLLSPKGIYYTPKARRDFEKNEVSPTPESFISMGPRYALRAILFAHRKGMFLKKERLVKSVARDASAFQVLIHLFKAFETGVEDAFFEDISFVPVLKGYSLPEEAILGLMGDVYNFVLDETQLKIYNACKELVRFS